MLIARVLAFALALLWPFAGTAGRGSVSTRIASDAHLLQQVAQRARHEAPDSLLSWLQRRGQVRTAALGLDGKTVDITFRDGLQMAVLPATSNLGRTISRPRTVALQRQLNGAEEPRAAVLDPFARNAGFDDGEAEVIDLQTAGFQVDHLVNEAVTVSAMTSLAKYSVVYMDTHSGVNQWGDGVVVTGQLANGDPQVAPLIQDHSVWIVGVAGDPHLYYGILSHFVTTSIGTFPPHALLFLNGCTLLKATLLLQALAAKSAGALVSWDGEVLVPDGTAAGAAFFHQMAGGASVQDAVSRVVASGRGQSFAQGQVGRLGYIGDGSVSLQEARDGASLPTAAPTATPTLVISSPTQAPRATSTGMPATRPRLSIVRIAVSRRLSGHWGSGRTVRLGQPVRFEVTYRSSGGPVTSPTGGISVAKGARAMLSVPLQTRGAALTADLQLRGRGLLGRLTATATLSYAVVAARRSVRLRVVP